MTGDENDKNLARNHRDFRVWYGGVVGWVFTYQANGMANLPLSGQLAAGGLVPGLEARARTADDTERLTLNASRGGNGAEMVLGTRAPFPTSPFDRLRGVSEVEPLKVPSRPRESPALLGGGDRGAEDGKSRGKPAPTARSASELAAYGGAVSGRSAFAEASADRKALPTGGTRPAVGSTGGSGDAGFLLRPRIRTDTIDAPTKPDRGVPLSPRLRWTRNPENRGVNPLLQLGARARSRPTGEALG